MAVAIVNTINGRFGLDISPATCHQQVYVSDLVSFVAQQLGLSAPPELSVATSLSPRPHATLPDIVIVGQALRLPGGINTPPAFWDVLIKQRTDIISPVPADRWDHASFYVPPSSTATPKPGDITFDRAGFVQLDSFDAAFFEISASEAMAVSPQTRLSLETAFEALEDAGITPSSVKGSDMGVWFAGGPGDGYKMLLHEEAGYEVMNPKELQHMNEEVMKMNSVC